MARMETKAGSEQISLRMAEELIPNVNKKPQPCILRPPFAFAPAIATPCRRRKKTSRNPSFMNMFRMKWHSQKDEVNVS